ncbi:hypothetical protein F1847_04340 [Thermodesulfobacterium sp. TA1]|uniref:prenyltransferase/squalene oxidase repeat-containing protein n=1 Tax=Thermodesulfobacterium sp. TA1 TaxID=2234087 RepID=UPI001231D3A8|nr:prenyltransferase/squalene oxidase repeat-containing protein [Thermodesulfobacterium sp. TA1]QER42013.1 hypothetical protein F1847_04340 [Thermodesulfobacterium sp. TA1]
MFLGLKKEVWKETFRFIQARKKPTGGFGATPLLPSTVEDTYYALSGMEVLKKIDPNLKYNPSKDHALKVWIKKNIEHAIKFGFSAKTLFYLTNITLKTLVKPPNRFLEFLEDWCTNFLRERLSDLEQIFYGVKIAKSLNWLNLDISCSVEIRNENVKEVYQLLWLQKEGGLKFSFSESKLLGWLKACYNPDGGYGFYPETTSYIENTFYALNSYFFLKIKPKNINKTQAFIVSCYVGKGGFARKPGGTAFLEATYYALECFKLITLLTL